MTISDILALFIGIIAALVAYVFLRKIWSLLSKDKPTASRVLENLSVGLLATILFVIFQKYMEAIQGSPPIDMESGKLFFKSLFNALVSFFITTALTLLVASSAIYVFLKLAMEKRGQK